MESSFHTFSLWHDPEPFNLIPSYQSGSECAKTAVSFEEDGQLSGIAGLLPCSET